MEKKPTGTFRQYAQRWKYISAQVEPLLTKTEITVLFINTLKAPFYDKLVGSATKDFANIVISGELIENAVKSGRIEGPESPYRAVTVKKKEAETHMRIIPEAIGKAINIPTLYGTPEAPIPEVGHSTENCLAFKKSVQGLIDAGILRFDGVSNVTGNPIPNHTSGNVNAVTNEDDWQAKGYVAKVRTHLRKVWEMMIENGLLCPSNKILKEESTKDQGFCDFHAVEGHDIQSCKEFRKLLQDTMDNKEIKVFDRMEGAEEGEICASDNQSIAFPYSVDKPLVIYYEAKKEGVSREVKPSLIIEVPAHFPYKDNKAVPWNYDVNIVVPEGEKPKVMSEGVSRVGHFTRSGRCYSPETVEPKKKVTNPSRKGKAPMYEIKAGVEIPSEQEVKKPVNDEEAHEFFKFIKYSEYNVVEQLHKQSARISVLSLLLNSEPHRNTLLKVLNQAYVANNVSVEKIDWWMNNLNADNFISFSDDEIPSNGRGFVKALHITTSCKGYIVPNVLIDNGEGIRWDTTRVMGKIQIPLEVGPCAYDIKFQVIDITPSDNCLLGRPWIHSAGAVPSSFHQKVKFIMDSRLITVAGDEHIVVSISSDAPYIEVSEDVVECSFRSFEFINATFVAKGNKIPTPKLSRNTKMGIKLTVGKGARANKGLGKYQEGMIRALKPMHHQGRCGLGFKPDIRQRRKQLQKNQERKIARALGRELEWEPMAYPPLSEIFTSAGVMYPRQDNPQVTLLIEKSLQNLSLNVIDNEDGAIENSSMIRPCPPRFSLNNWTAVDRLVVFKSPSECLDIIGMNNPVTNPEIDFEKAVCLGEYEADENVEDCVSSPDLLRMVEQEEKQILPHQKYVEVVNLGSEEKKQEVKIGTSISENTKRDLIALLHEYKDVFAWSFQDMPGLNTDIVVHKLPLKPECKPVQQKLRRMRPEMLLKIKEEINKQFDAGFLQVSKYPEWVANIVPVPKKDGKVRMCVDYRYNQIKMAPEDMEKTTFITMWGTFCYKYMMESPALSGRMARWQILQTEYDITYVNQKLIKGSVIADFLASRTMEEYEPLRLDFPDENLMCILEKGGQSSKEKS
ncbi:uncharacterized protein LOC105778992 [Gossypium raimondii]|uniref:uncharacterized protein LOC105778992 n=1 Tax=Gossypium raimondii TaxID=29730 RepID=UPI00227B8E93|nr:uncharacterized protein LOC105778992 [Gossypium raimondii]